ncbi:hypothetical protein TNCV_1218461 [Trichonephila clavipes]|nr:hypothetical protein TNCV_1218461 [Trichonephila clavipes]
MWSMSDTERESCINVTLHEAIGEGPPNSDFRVITSPRGEPHSLRNAGLSQVTRTISELAPLSPNFHTTLTHRTARLQWCREHHNWTEQDWACVPFSDEKVRLSSDCRRQLIWRESGTAYRPENIQEKDRYPTCIHGVGRHHSSPTCGCEWDYDGPTIH